MMHEQISEFLRYWDGLRDGADLPAKDRIDPLAIPRRLLSNVFLMVYDDHRDDVCFTLVGSYAHIARGMELSGTYAADLPNRMGGTREAYAEYIRDHYRMARRLRRPVHSRGAYRWIAGQRDVITERIVCPILGRDGRTIEFTGFQSVEHAAPSRPVPLNDADDYVSEFVRVIEDLDTEIT
ncbi:MAG: PAS domain-containing protein [Thalassobaculum sp.]|uniref:PAS domain-containing protein n=1 Tax=Thalassobaculum sp. TaxID=2022740 RepID=UPI0032EFA5A8